MTAQGRHSLGPLRLAAASTAFTSTRFVPPGNVIDRSVLKTTRVVHPPDDSRRTTHQRADSPAAGTISSDPFATRSAGAPGTDESSHGNAGRMARVRYSSAESDAATAPPLRVSVDVVL